MPPRRGWEIWWRGCLQRFRSDGAHCVRSVAAGEWQWGVWEYFYTARYLAVLRLGFATAALQPQVGCGIQPSVGALRLRVTPHSGAAIADATLF